MSTFPEKVILHRKKLKLTQKELAELSGIARRSIISYENGQKLPQHKQLYKLAKTLNVSTEYLINDEIDDPAYGLDRMDYVEEMRKKAGNKEALDLEEMLRQNQALFAGGTISEEAKDAYFQALMKAYLECKEIASQKFGAKKANE